MWWLCWTLAAAEEPAVDLYYETVNFHVTVPLPTQAQRFLTKELRNNDLSLWFEAQDGSVTEIRPGSSLLSNAVRQAVLVPLYLERTGAEMDFVAERGDGWLTLCTVRWEADQRLVVSRSRHPTGLHADGPSEAALRERYGIGPLVEGDRPIDGLTRGLVQASLERLSAGDLSLLAGVPIHRLFEPSSFQDTVPAAQYVHGEDPRVEIFDGAFSSTPNYVGEPWDPSAYTVKIVVHELGHALAAAPARAHRSTTDALTHRLDEARDEAQALTERELAGAAAEARAVRLESLARTVAEARTRLDELMNLRGDPVTEAYLAAVGDEAAPTTYGRSQPREGFAESFALFYLDRRALKRTSPKAEAWFAAGGHTAAAQAAVDQIAAGGG